MKAIDLMKYGIGGYNVGKQEKPIQKVKCNQSKIDICLNCTKKRCKTGECEIIKNKGEK